MYKIGNPPDKDRSTRYIILYHKRKIVKMPKVA